MYFLKLILLSNRIFRKRFVNGKLPQTSLHANFLSYPLFFSCAWCSASLVGQVPFERLAYKYCSTACVRAHRLDMETQQQR